MKVRAIAGLVSVAVVLFLVGCAGGPSRTSKEAGPPEWVLQAPGEREGYVYFVGAGETDSLAQSEQAARREIIDQIMQFIGVDVTSQTDTTVKATLDSYQADMVKSIQVSGRARLKGLELADKWVNPKDGTTVYLLARYNKADLVAEQKKIEARIKEILDLVARPEAQAAEYEDEGRYFEAAVGYIQAAAAAYKLDIPNKEVKFERNINNAKTAIEHLNVLRRSDDNVEMVAGQEMSQPFEAIVVNGATMSDPGVAGVRVKIVYRVSRGDGKMRTRTMSAKSDEHGVVSFTLPPPQFVGTERVTVRLDLGPYLETLESAPQKYQQMIGGLEELAVQRKAVITYRVISLAKDVPTGIAVIDVDAARNPLPGSMTAAGILEELSSNQFKVRTLQAKAEAIVGVGDAQIAQWAKEQFSGTVARIIFGTAQIAGFEKDGDKVVLKVKASVRVVDLDTGETRLSVSRSTSAIGNNPETAATSAFRKIGQLVGKEIAAKLW